MITLSIKQGRTYPIEADLPLDGAVTESLSGATVEAIIYDRTGALKTSMGTSAITNAATRRVSFTPASADKLLASESPYRVSWKVTTASGIYHHSPAGDYWRVYA